MYVCMCQVLSGFYCYYCYYTWRLVSNFIWLWWWKYFLKAFFVQLASRIGQRANYGSKHNGLWFMCKVFGHFCSGWATWCTRPSSDIGEWSKYHRECNRYEFLLFSVLFVSIPGCCCCFFPPWKERSKPIIYFPWKKTQIYWSGHHTERILGRLLSSQNRQAILC